MRNVFYENASMPGVPMNLTLRKGDNFVVVNRYSKISNLLSPIGPFV